MPYSRQPPGYGRRCLAIPRRTLRHPEPTHIVSYTFTLPSKRAHAQSRKRHTYAYGARMALSLIGLLREYLKAKLAGQRYFGAQECRRQTNAPMRISAAFQYERRVLAARPTICRSSVTSQCLRPDATPLSFDADGRIPLVLLLAHEAIRSDNLLARQCRHQRSAAFCDALDNAN